MVRLGKPINIEAAILEASDDDAAQLSNVEIATALAQAGIPVFPCGADKKPHARHWREESTTAADRIKDWWGWDTQALVGIDLGKIDLIVIDADRHGPVDGVAELAAIVGDDFTALGCPVVVTPRDGRHLFFRQPDGEPLGNRTGRLPIGIDVRGAGGLVIAPESYRPDGSAWRPMEGTPLLAEAFKAGSIPPLPKLIEDMIRATRDKGETADDRAKGGPEPKFESAAGAREKAWAARALEGIQADLASMGRDTGRNIALNKSAFRMATMVARGWIAESEVRAALEDACKQNGLWKEDGPTQCRKTIESGLRGGMAKPHEDLPDSENEAELQRLGDSISRALSRGSDGTLYDSETGEVVEEPKPVKEAGEDGPKAGEKASETNRTENPKAQDETQTGEQGKAREGDDSDPLKGFVFDGDAPVEPPPMLVKKLVPLGGICFIGGQSGAGKTFIAVDLAVSLASGAAFFSNKVAERVGVAIFAAEGEGTIANRVIVARKHKTQSEKLPIAWLGAVPNLAEPKQVKTMVQRLRAVDERFRADHGVRLGAVICDTLAASFNLEDENNNSEAAKAIRIMKLMGEALGVVVIPVHHYGKGVETGLRGASAWRAGCDTVLSVLADRDQTTGACSNRRIALTKTRDGEEGWMAPFDLRSVKLGVDEDGEEYGACYIEPGMQTGAWDGGPEKRARPLSDTCRSYLKALDALVGDCGERIRPFGMGGPEVVAVDREKVREEFYCSHPVDSLDDQKASAAKRKAFGRAEEEARKRNLVAARNIGDVFYVWRVKEPAQ